jgi:hypothetical protein
MKAHYPRWDITKTLEATVSDIVDAWRVGRPLAAG